MPIRADTRYKEGVLLKKYEHFKVIVPTILAFLKEFS